MRTIFFILQKEFRQIFRNKGMLPIIFVAPIIQLLILVNAATFEMKDLKLYVIDQDQSQFSRQLISQFRASPYFKIIDSGTGAGEGREILDKGTADFILHLPRNFEKDLFREGKATVQLVINAIDGMKAGLGMSYAGEVIMDFNGNIIEEYGFKRGVVVSNPNTNTIDVTYSNWYNPDLDYKTFMVPGILVLLVTMIGAFLGSMNIVREKEAGTIEQLNVTPIRKYEFIIGKLLPFWLLALFELALGLFIAKLIYDTPIIGSIGLIFGFAALYLLVVLGIGLFISTVTETQQQAMFISWFFLVIFILLSGLFTAIENMPLWAQKLTLFNPVRYFIEVTRMVMLKGAGFMEIQRHFIILAFYAVAINGLAVWRYRKRV